MASNGVQLNVTSPCLFPFTYEGRQYYTCTTANHHESWCATDVDLLTGQMLSWGPCQANCPGFEPADVDRCQIIDGRVRPAVVRCIKHAAIQSDNECM